MIGFKSEPTPPSGGGDGDETVTISLDATTKTLPRLEEFVLKATVSNGKTVTWSSSDPTIASVTADGNKATVKGLKVGTATITAKIGDVTATCEVTVDFATGLEEAIANTAVYGKDGYIHIQPVAPMQAWVVNIAGTVVYHATISSATQIPVSTGIYLVKLGTGSESVVTKVSVR
ncbi:T9SS C-terminal target domain-containing protein [Parabacteroides sp. AF48-14]|nr:T9SS C-terminal target domain-containing protein [Parabacteroides sp. AF48-14]